MHCRQWFLMLAIVIAAQVGWAGRAAKDRVVGPVMMTGIEDTRHADTGSVPRLPRNSLDDCATANGACDTSGFSWYDLQSNGTMGHQIGTDSLGFVHSVYTNGLNEGASIRHVFCNVFDPTTGTFATPSGAQIDASTRAGFVVTAVHPSGFAFPAFHSASGTAIFATVGIDYLAGTCAYTNVTCPPLDEQQGIWPKIAIDRTGDLHMVAKETAGTPNEEFYESAHPIYDDFGAGLDIECDGWQQWMMTDWFITMDVAASRHTDRVAVAWISEVEHPEYEGFARRNIFLSISEDRGQNWGEPINVTDLSIVDTSCVTFGGDPFVCNGDSMEPWLDLNILIDDEDNVHIAFDGSAHLYWDYDATWLDASLIYSTVWHWDLNSQNFHYIDQEWFGMGGGATLGVNMLMCHRGNMAQDTTTGDLYMAYQKFDSSQWSDDLYGQADLWITKSTDGGCRWSVPFNLTNTDGGQGAARWECLHERDLSLAPYISNGMLYLQYMLDLDAGTSVTATAEGEPTLNPVILSQIPVADIPAEPLQNKYPYHADSSGFPFECTTGADERPGYKPTAFGLHQNYPNPFNPRTTISFDVRGNAPVTLTVFDITGREIVTLIDGTVLGAGSHEIEFDGTSAASGVYFYRLSEGSRSDARKMVLLK